MWTEYVEPAYRARAPRVILDERGRLLVRRHRLIEPQPQRPHPGGIRLVRPMAPELGDRDAWVTAEVDRALVLEVVLVVAAQHVHVLDDVYEWRGAELLH